MTFSQQKNMAAAKIVLLAAFGAPALFGEPQRSEQGSNAPAVFSSRILLDDGRPPLEPISVSLICNEEVRSEAVADANGRFELSFVGGNSRECLLRASSRGYRPATVRVGHLPQSPDVAALTLHRKGKWQGDTISVTHLAAPPAAVEAFHAAVREMRRGSEAGFRAATQSLEKAVEKYPDYAAAWFELGRIRLLRNDVSGARTAFASAVEADPWFVSPYEPLLLLDLAQERWSEARKLCDRMLALNPYLSEAQYHRGIASLNLGDIESARRAAAALANGPEAGKFALRHHLQGLIHEEEGDLEAAAAEYREYLSAEPGGAPANELRRRLRKWEAQGKVVKEGN